MRRALSCVDQGFPRLSHGAALRVIRDLGFERVDLCVTTGGPHIRAEDVVAEPVAQAQALRRRAEPLGLTVSDVFLIIGLDELAVNHPNSVVRDESFRFFRAAAAFAREVGSPGITLLPGVHFHGVPVDDTIALAASELTRRIDEAAGLAVSIEPHVGSIVESEAATLSLLAREPQLSLTLDHSHFLYQGIDLRQLEPLIARTRHLQIRQAAPNVMQARALEGALNLDALRVQLDEGGYDGTVALEYLWDDWLDCDRLDVVSETAELRDLLIAHGVAGDGIA